MLTEVPCLTSQRGHTGCGHTTHLVMSYSTANIRTAEISGSEITAEDSIPSNHGLTPVGWVGFSLGLTYANLPAIPQK